MEISKCYRSGLSPPPPINWLLNNYYHIAPLSLYLPAPNDWSIWRHKGQHSLILDNTEGPPQLQSSHRDSLGPLLWLHDSLIFPILLLPLLHRCYPWKHSPNKLPAHRSPSAILFTRVPTCDTGLEPHCTLNWLLSWQLQDSLPYLFMSASTMKPWVPWSQKLYFISVSWYILYTQWTMNVWNNFRKRSFVSGYLLWVPWDARHGHSGLLVWRNNSKGYLLGR